MTDLHSTSSKISWVDLTVESVDQALEFYTKAAGWKSSVVHSIDAFKLKPDISVV